VVRLGGCNASYRHICGSGSDACECGSADADVHEPGIRKTSSARARYVLAPPALCMNRRAVLIDIPSRRGRVHQMMLPLAVMSVAPGDCAVRPVSEVMSVFAPDAAAAKSGGAHRMQ